MFKISFRAPLYSLLVLFALCGFAAAQGTTSRLTGTVTDESGAVVAGE